MITPVLAGLEKNVLQSPHPQTTTARMGSVAPIPKSRFFKMRLGMCPQLRRAIGDYEEMRMFEFDVRKNAKKRSRLVISYLLSVIGYWGGSKQRERSVGVGADSYPAIAAVCQANGPETEISVQPVTSGIKSSGTSNAAVAISRIDES